MRTITTNFLEQFSVTFFRELVDIIKLCVCLGVQYCMDIEVQYTVYRLYKCTYTYIIE